MDPPSHKRVSKACDACKRRKVRCNGQPRCQQCAHLGLRCIYSPSSKQRSQGKRGHIISEFRKQTSSLPAISPPILPAHAGQADYHAPFSPLSPTASLSHAESSMSAGISFNKLLGMLLLTPGSLSRILSYPTVHQGLLS